MPPILASDESDSEGLDSIPSKPVKNNGRQAKPKEVEVASGASDNEDEDDSEEDGETFAVEKILQHQTIKGTVLYQVKWLGYEAESDLTWEPADHLAEGAADILDEYHKKIGGPPGAKAKGGRGKRKPVSTTSSPAPSRPAKKSKTNGEEWTAPIGSWEDDVESIQTICDDNAGSGKLELHVFMCFKGGHKTKFPMGLVRQKCPQRLLDYYEKHLWVNGKRPAGK